MGTVTTPVKLSNVRSVFGAPTGTHLSAFIRGGAYVPNISANSGVPTATPIKLSQLGGATNYTPVSASMSPTSLTGSGSGSSGGSSAGPATCTASGGSGTITYTWAYVSGSTTIVGSPSGNTCTFRYPTGSTGTITAIWKCTASDGTSSSAPTVSVQLTNT